MHVWVHGCMGIWVHACMGVCVGAWVDGCMHGCGWIGVWVYGGMGVWGEMKNRANMVDRRQRFQKSVEELLVWRLETVSAESSHRLT